MTTIVVIEIRPHVGAIRFEDRFCASRKGGTGGGGWVHRSGWPCMAAVAAGYRKGLVSADRAWRLLQLAIERAWSALDGLFFCFLVRTSVENGAFTLKELHFWLFRQLSVWRSVLWSEGPDYWTLGKWVGVVRVMNLQRTSEGSCGSRFLG